MKRKYNCVELFAGSGGLGTGFANSGFNIISANDVWKAAGETYTTNHPNVKYVVKSILKGTVLINIPGVFFSLNVVLFNIGVPITKFFKF